MQVIHLLALLVVVGLLLVLVLWWVVDELKKSRRRQIQPILQFFQTADQAWWVENIGVGSALNVCLLFKEREGQWGWQQPIALPALAPGSRSPLPLQDADRWAIIGIRYQDVEHQSFSTIFNSRTKVFRYRRRWIYSFTKPLGFPTIK